MIYQLGQVSPDVAPDVGFVAPNAAVIGDVRLGSEASVWFSVTIRGDNEPVRIGRRTNIQDNSVCHSDPGFALTVGADVTVGHSVTLHGCTVEDGALIGMGAIVMNGATIGAGALVAAGSLVPEDRHIPAGMLAVGRPAKVMRPLDAAEADMLKASAGIYVRNAKKFNLSLKPLGS